MKPIWQTALGIGAVGGIGLAYAAGIEVRNFTVRHVTIPVLPPGQAPLRILHISDLHLTPRQGLKLRWIASLARWRPQLVINTGDNIAHPDAVAPLLEAFGALLEVPGAFVFGSNDYFSPSLRNPIKYLLPDDGLRYTDTDQLPWPTLRDAFVSRGWTNLTNTRATIRVDDRRIALVGVDDPHLYYDDLAAVAGPADPAADLRIGVTHAPYLRVLDQFSQDGYELLFAGHTHGGQLRLPGIGALVTNCDLEPARARGLSRHPAVAPAGTPGTSWLHVSAGAGTSPYAPVRFCCRPEASLVTLTAASP